MLASDWPMPHIGSLSLAERAGCGRAAVPARATGG